jgi:hypothetical protein
MMKHGRKFAVTVGGMALTAALAFGAMATGVAQPDAAFATLGLMVGAFCGSNAWATPKTPAGDA